MQRSGSTSCALLKFETGRRRVHARLMARVDPFVIPEGIDREIGASDRLHAVLRWFADAVRATCAKPSAGCLGRFPDGVVLRSAPQNMAGSRPSFPIVGILAVIVKRVVDMMIRLLLTPETLVGNPGWLRRPHAVLPRASLV